MPEGGFTAFYTSMLDHPNITVVLNAPWEAAICKHKSLLWTGPLDQYFGKAYGSLPYRGLKIEWSHEALPCLGTVFPNSKDPLTRAIDIRHITNQLALKACTSYEYPCADGMPAYPMPTEKAERMASIYRQAAKEEEQSGVYFAGRLATYRYYNIDEVMAQALQLAERVLL
jgi:UDP-galactopyranose mutase